MARPKDGQDLTTVMVRVYHETYKMLRDIARCRCVAGGVRAPTNAKIVEELLETAFRCFEDHGADYARPYSGRAAFSRAKKIAGAIGNHKNPPHRPRGSKDLKPRKKRSP